MNRFSKDNQPEGRGRKPIPAEKRKVRMDVSVSPEVKEWYSRRKGKAGVVLENYMKEQQK